MLPPDRVIDSLGKCAHVEYDVGFVLDTSGSMQPKDWDIEKKFVKDLVKGLKMSPSGGHAAVTLFSSTANLEIKFSDHTNFNSFEAAVDGLPKANGGTRMDTGMYVALEQMFNTSNGMRPSAAKSVLLITDGQNGVPNWQDPVRNQYRARKIKIVVIGAGNVNKAELKRLVIDHQEDLHIASSMEALKMGTLFKDVGEGLCDGMTNFIS